MQEYKITFIVPGRMFENDLLSYLFFKNENFVFQDRDDNDYFNVKPEMVRSNNGEDRNTTFVLTKVPIKKEDIK